MSSVVVRPIGGVPDCSLCRSSTDASAVACQGCGAHYHSACLEELRIGCATIGCARRLERRREPAEGEPHPLLWIAALLGGVAMFLVEALGPAFGRDRVGGALVLVALLVWLTSVLWRAPARPNDKDRR